MPLPATSSAVAASAVSGAARHEVSLRTLTAPCCFQHLPTLHWASLSQHPHSTTAAALTCTRQRRARPAATTLLAAWRAMYAPDLSTLVGSLPEKAPPPCAPQPPYVSMMILRPVRPASPWGPPITKRPASRDSGTAGQWFIDTVVQQCFVLPPACNICDCHASLNTAVTDQRPAKPVPDPVHHCCNKFNPPVLPENLPPPAANNSYDMASADNIPSHHCVCHLNAGDHIWCAFTFQYAYFRHGDLQYFLLLFLVFT